MSCDYISRRNTWSLASHTCLTERITHAAFKVFVGHMHKFFIRINLTDFKSQTLQRGSGFLHNFIINWRGQWKKGISHVFDKMEFCMLLLRSIHLLFARNVLSTHTQSFLVIRNNYLNANFSNRVIFIHSAFMQVTTISKYSKTDWKSYLLITLKYCVCNALCLKQCLKSFIAPKQRYRQ